jgi:hypothetical protein
VNISLSCLHLRSFSLTAPGWADEITPPLRHSLPVVCRFAPEFLHAWQSRIGITPLGGCRMAHPHRWVCYAQLCCLLVSYSRKRLLAANQERLAYSCFFVQNKAREEVPPGLHQFRTKADSNLAGASYFLRRATMPAAKEPRPKRPIRGRGEAVCGRCLPALLVPA